MLEIKPAGWLVALAAADE
uniref:Uncharacterized protein n=1 Tax=Arundo donax TaxID=35708 RepID=A0A0A9BDD1_ARUDO